MNVRVGERNGLSGWKTAPWADTSRRPYVSGDTVYFPVKQGYPFDFTLPDRSPYHGPGYQRVGDTIILHGDAPTAENLQLLIAQTRPSCVVSIPRQTGVMRIPAAQVLYGTPHEVTFRESGIIYSMNPAEVMFSQGNREEKTRIRTLVRPGERVADMFAGIGYFTLSAAAAGAQVHAMELNPVSFGYLVKNIAQNNLTGRVRSVCGDCRTSLDGIYDRILMGHFEAPSFISAALTHGTSGTTLHIHGLGSRQSEIEDAILSAGFRYDISEHKVKKYASRIWHCVWDVTLK